jgi:hypothetical protein
VSLEKAMKTELIQASLDEAQGLREELQIGFVYLIHDPRGTPSFIHSQEEKSLEDAISRARDLSISHPGFSVIFFRPSRQFLAILKDV